MRILFKNACLLDGKNALQGNLLVEGDKIHSIGDLNFLPAADRIIDCRGNILMPALYNAHTHGAMTLMRGLGSDLQLQDWLTKAIFPAEAKLTPEAVYLGTQLAMLEMLRFGTAGFADMYYYMDAVCEAAIEAGMNVAPGWASSIENQTRIYNRFKVDSHVRVFAGIHAEYTTSEAEIRDVAAFAAQYHLPVHVHVSETRSETEGCIARHGQTPTAYLADLHAFDFGGIAAHCVWTTPEDRAILKEKGVYAVHNPISNLKLGSGVMPMQAYLEESVPIALGTDGCASNNTLNLFEEMRFAAVLHKGVTGKVDLLSPKQLFDMATRQSALACGFENSGKLCAGAQADLILLDVSCPHAQPMNDPYVHAAYSAQGSDVLMTMVQGKVLYDHGQYLTLDAQKILADAGKWFKENSI